MDAAARSRHEAARCLLLAEAFADAPTAEVVERCRAAWAEADERQGGRAGINCANSGTDGNAKADHSSDFAGSGCTTGHLENAFSEPALRDIRVDYTALCCGTNADSPLPYESIYRGGERLLKGPGCVGLAELYEREGFLPPKGASNEPEDFLPTLLGFLAFLHEEEADAREAGDDGAAARATNLADAFRLHPVLPASARRAARARRGRRTYGRPCRPKGRGRAQAALPRRTRWPTPAWGWRIRLARLLALPRFHLPCRPRSMIMNPFLLYMQQRKTMDRHLPVISRSSLFDGIDHARAATHEDRPCCAWAT